MFGMGTIIPPVEPRKAETTDTQQRIRRPQDDRNKKNPKRFQDLVASNLNDTDDHLDVSVDALILYFQKQLGPKPNYLRNGNNDNVFQHHLFEHNQEASMRYAARQAYTKSQKTAKSTPAHLNAPSAAGKNTTNAMDHRRIDHIIDELEILKLRHIDHVTIERGPDFLTSVETTIEHMLDKFDHLPPA